jgi:hypothetical protein
MSELSIEELQKEFEQSLARTIQPEAVASQVGLMTVISVRFCCSSWLIVCLMF